MVSISCVVHGKVQGVGYRAYIEGVASELSLTGYIKNNPDGTVLVVAQGVPDSLKTFVECIHEGSVLSVVEAVQVSWIDEDVTYQDFSVLQ
jgi:acylphosphatase